MPREFPSHRHETRPSAEELSHIEAKVFDRLVVPYKQESIKLDDFADLYKSSILASDEEAISRKKSHFEHEAGTRAQILEAILGTQIELSDWFGPDAQTLPTSEYDDLFNGVDMAVEFADQGSYQHLAMSIDATSNPDAVGTKLDRIKEHILKGELTQIKYFVSERLHFRGEQNNVPYVIVGADTETIRELSDLWLNVENLKTLTQRREHGGAPLTAEAEKANHQRFVEFRDRLARHPIQMEVLEQIEMQLLKFEEFAMRHQQDSLATRYRAIGEIIQGIIALKKSDRIPAAERPNIISKTLRDLLKDF